MGRLISFLYLHIQRMADRLSHKPGMPREFALQCCRQLSGYLGKSPSTSRSSPESVSGGVNLYSVCVCVCGCVRARMLFLGFPSILCASPTCWPGRSGSSPHNWAPGMHVRQILQQCVGGGRFLVAFGLSVPLLAFRQFFSKLSNSSN